MSQLYKIKERMRIEDQILYLSRVALSLVELTSVELLLIHGTCADHDLNGLGRFTASCHY
jgi:hypothetical protein